jgi:hypothetical protein
LHLAADTRVIAQAALAAQHELRTVRVTVRHQDVSGTTIAAIALAVTPSQGTPPSRRSLEDALDLDFLRKKRWRLLEDFGNGKHGA